MSVLLALIEYIPFLGALRTAVVPYGLLNTAHILCLGVLLGTILPLDLGILGWRRFGWAVDATVPLRRLAISAFVAAAMTGSLLFAVRPLDYLGNDAFLLKVALIVIAGINALAFAFATSNAVRRLLAAGSIALWLATVTAGRWIAFA